MRQLFAHPVLALGFRPFYLLATAFAALQVAHWGAVYGGFAAQTGYFPGALHHAHEMIFGYIVAVIVGFLLTAAQNWTGIATLRGASLAGLSAIWVLGRLAMVGWSFVPPPLAALLDMAFLPFAALALALPLLRSGNRRNYAMPLFLLALALANGALHLAALGLLDAVDTKAVPLAFGLVALLIVLMGGRVIPAFTGSALPDAGVGRNAVLDWAALVSTAAVPLSDLFAVPWPALHTALLAAAALTNAARMITWKPMATLRQPLLWVLHLAYAWIAVYFLLRLLAELDTFVDLTIALHALTVGAIGTITLGMMCRTSRGHSGEALVAAPLETLCFALVTLAALLRVFAPLLWPQAYAVEVALSAGLWVAAFGLFFVSLWPRLTRPRRDGRPG